LADTQSGTSVHLELLPRHSFFSNYHSFSPLALMDMCLLHSLKFRAICHEANPPLLLRSSVDVLP